MPLVTVGAPEGVDTLDEIREWVRGTEALLGPIVEIGNDGTRTGGKFDQNNPANPGPDTDADVGQTADGNAPPGRTKVCDGWVLVAGQPVRVVVYR
ncbi:MAG: hypothetical protein QOC98_3389 [Frankiaceae bacterium]|nr:hypothetical protein [Frankiaceae bacterium]